MGKSYTPPFAVEYHDQRGRHFTSWEHRTSPPYHGPGRPTDAKVEEWRQKMNAYYQRMGEGALGFVLHISSVRVYRQSTGETVARATMPMFEVV